MYSVCVSATFEATHAVTINGIDEKPHTHEWSVDVVIAGDTLNTDGVLIDFVLVENQLASVIKPLINTNLNSNKKLSGGSPSAERVAQYIGNEMEKHILGNVHVQSVTITEAPNCKATYTL
jgi:6-pyruvoyltetrahydropterin/6-carboxytetrahydropterin synthase